MLGVFWSLTRGHRRAFLLGSILLLVTNALAVSIPALVGRVVDALAERKPLSLIALFGVAIIVIALLQAGIRTLSRLMILGASRKIVFELRGRFFSQLLRLSASYYDQHSTGDIMSRGINDTRILRSVYGPGVMNLLNTTLLYAAALTLLVRIDLTLTVLALLPFPAVFLVVSRISRHIYSRSLSVQQQLASISERARENFAGSNQVRIFAQEEREIAAFNRECAEYRTRSLSMAALRGTMLSLIGVIAGIGVLIVLVYGGGLVVRGQISLGDFVAFNSYLGMLTWPTIAMGWIVSVFHRGSAALERLREVIEVDPEIPPALDESANDQGPELSGEIRIKGLTFTYAGAGRPALEELNLEISEGSRVGLVGLVGSGKSTLVDLLARVYSVPAGTVFIGGEDITRIPVSSVRQCIGYVPQESFLFSRSLRENIALSGPEISEEDLRSAISVAQLKGDLKQLDNGLDTVVGERGVTLSGGQRQRASLARALLKKPRILILDDSLSAVDADTEARILDDLSKVMAGCTTLFISHRLSTLSSMDRLLVFDRGRIVEDGTHEELLALDGVYAKEYRHHLLEERLEDR